MIYAFLQTGRTIGIEVGGTFTWAILPRYALHVTREFAEDLCVNDGGGMTYSGDGFWAMAGQWAWDRTGVR